MIEVKQWQKHIAGLDALRTLAITLITLFHIFPDTFAGGYIGVCLFLVITGFLLSYSSACDYMSDNFNILQYYLKRLKRLYPPLLVVILVTVGLYHFILPGVLEDSGKEIVSILFGFNNWWQLAMNADYFARVVNASPFTHMWFMGVEIEYVILWPLLFTLCVLLKNWNTSSILLFFLGLISAAMMVFMSFQGVDISRLYYGTDTRVFACLLGGTIGLWFAKSKSELYGSNILSQHEALLGILLVPVLIATFLLPGQDLLLYKGGMQILTLVFCLMLFVVIDDPRLGSCLESPLFKWIGSHSYEIFLWQYPVLFLFQRKGWHDLTYGSVLEILIILILTSWSKEIPTLIFKFKLPFSGEELKSYLPRYIFASVTILSAVIMYFGMRDVLASDFNPQHQPGYKLKMELEQKQAALAKAQAERTAREAEQAEKIKNEQEKLAARLRGSGITMIGDSVMVGSSPAISELMPDAYVDALSSRDVCGGFETAQNLQQEGKLSDIVVIALGTNGPLLEHEPYATGMQNLLNVLGTQRQIFWITVYCSYSQWMAMNNKYLAELEQTRPNFHLIDWYPLARSHPDWLHSDGTHPNMDGAEQYAKLIYDTLAQKLSFAP